MVSSLPLRGVSNHLCKHVHWLCGRKEEEEGRRKGRRGKKGMRWGGEGRGGDGVKKKKIKKNKAEFPIPLAFSSLSMVNFIFSYVSSYTATSQVHKSRNKLVDR